MAKKNKFEFKKLVQKDYVSEGDKFYFVSDPTFYATLQKTPQGTYKLMYEGNEYAPHALVVTWLGMEPNNAALQWIKSDEDRTLYEIWDDFQAGVEPMKKAA